MHSDDYEEKAARRKKKADLISLRTKEFLIALLQEQAKLEEQFRKADKKKGRGRKKTQPDIEIPEIVQQVIDSQAPDLQQHERELLAHMHLLIEKYEKRIVSFIREQITSDDGKYL